MSNTPEQRALQFLGKLVKGPEFEGRTFLAGGAVRDEIMGKPVKDIDIVVSMPDGGIKFAEWVTKRIGRYKEGTNPLVFPRFGTAKFNLRGITDGEIDLSNVDIEVVMTRGEKYEKGSRKPEVIYADLEDDAFRRDLTVNSLFKDIVTGEIKDLTGRGIEDIKAGIVRTPTDPDQTFKDDPLRMLRAIRFAVKYNWKMPLSMVKALKKNADMLQNISQERIRDELNKMLVTDNPDKALRLLTASGLNKHVIPELDACVGVTQNEYHKDDVYDHILEVVKNTLPDLMARLSSLFHDIGKPVTRSVGPDGRVHFYMHEDVGAEMAEKIMSRLRYNKNEIETVKKVVSSHMMLKSAGKDGEKASDKQLRKFAVRLGPDLGTAMKVMHADNVSHSEYSSMPNQIPNIVTKIKTLLQGTAAEKPKLPINGNDIITILGIKPGPDIKKYLDVVQDAWYKDPSISKENALKLVKAVHSVNLKKTLGPQLNQKIKNPETGNDILVKTALSYDKDHPARQAAMKLLRQRKK
jgi:poly(A) polymerase